MPQTDRHSGVGTGNTFSNYILNEPYGMNQDDILERARYFHSTMIDSTNPSIMLYRLQLALDLTTFSSIVHAHGVKGSKERIKEERSIALSRITRFVRRNSNE